MFLALVTKENNMSLCIFLLEKYQNVLFLPSANKEFFCLTYIKGKKKYCRETLDLSLKSQELFFYLLKSFKTVKRPGITVEPQSTFSWKVLRSRI